MSRAPCVVPVMRYLFFQHAQTSTLSPKPHPRVQGFDRSFVLYGFLRSFVRSFAQGDRRARGHTQAHSGTLRLKGQLHRWMSITLITQYINRRRYSMACTRYPCMLDIQLAKMSSDKIFDLTAGVYFYFYIILERGWQLAAMSWARQQCQLSVHPES